MLIHYFCPPWFYLTGILHSKMGISGGYYLAHPPEQISLGQIVRVLDGASNNWLPDIPIAGSGLSRTRRSAFVWRQSAVPILVEFLEEIGEGSISKAKALWVLTREHLSEHPVNYYFRIVINAGVINANGDHFKFKFNPFSDVHAKPEEPTPKMPKKLTSSGAFSLL
jgi:hypothetical protein